MSSNVRFILKPYLEPEFKRFISDVTLERVFSENNTPADYIYSFSCKPINELLQTISNSYIIHVRYFINHNWVTIDSTLKYNIEGLSIEEKEELLVIREDISQFLSRYGKVFTSPDLYSSISSDYSSEQLSKMKYVEVSKYRHQLDQFNQYYYVNIEIKNPLYDFVQVIETLIFSSELDEVDSILSNFDVNRAKLQLLISILRSSYRVRDLVIHWYPLLELIKTRLNEDGEDTDSLLIGLY